jgi:hypothetical protein
MYSASLIGNERGLLEVKTLRVVKYNVVRVGYILFPFGNQESLPIAVFILIRKFITPRLLVTFRLEFGTVLQLIRPTVLN